MPNTKGKKSISGQGALYPELVAGRRLNGDEAWYRVNLGPKPRVLLGKVYRFH